MCNVASLRTYLKLEETLVTHPPPPPPKSLPRLHIRLDFSRCAVGVKINADACLAPREERPEARLTGTKARVAADGATVRAKKKVSHDTEGVFIKGVKNRPILKLARFGARSWVMVAYRLGVIAGWWTCRI